MFFELILEYAGTPGENDSPIQLDEVITIAKAHVVSLRWIDSAEITEVSLTSGITYQSPMTKAEIIALIEAPNV